MIIVYFIRTVYIIITVQIYVTSDECIVYLYRLKYHNVMSILKHKTFCLYQHTAVCFILLLELFIVYTYCIKIKSEIYEIYEIQINI